MHGSLGDACDLGLYPRIVRQLVDAFLPDHRRIHIGNQQPFLAWSRRLRDDIHPFPVHECRPDGRSGSRKFEIGRVAMIDPADEL